MKKISRIFTFGLMGCLLLNSCSNDDDVTDDVNPEPEGAYQDGFFILNEGKFGSNNSSISFISNDLTGIQHDIFNEVNEASLGDTGQSITFDDEFAYIIVNGSNIIQIVDRYTFELIDTVESDLQSPRYAVIENGKIYVTNQGSYEEPGVTEFDDFIAIIDLESLEVEKTVETNTRLEYIQEEEGLIYAQNAAFGNGNGITVIDSDSDEIINTIETKIEDSEEGEEASEGTLNSFEIEDGILYALSSATLEKIDLASGEVLTEMEIEDGGAANLEIEADNIYYTINGSSVYSMEISATDVPDESLFDFSNITYLYAFKVENDRIFIGDAGEFSANGFVQVYDLNGELMEEIEAGIGPNSVYIQN